MRFLSAVYANEEHSAVVAQTDKNGAVLISEADRPALWSDLMASGVAIAAFERPPPPTLTRVSKADLWRRLTDEEAEMVDAKLAASPLRLRRIFQAAQFIDTTDPDYDALRAGVIAVVGKDRAAVVLEPTH
ncbi:hypothetical protein OIU35_31535 [Boseaceae bacterium BT-24-1]|nr:hypothetical protein [Boseaceae bacterium BT-24-1]